MKAYFDSIRFVRVNAQTLFLFFNYILFVNQPLLSTVNQKVMVLNQEVAKYFTLNKEVMITSTTYTTRMSVGAVISLEFSPTFMRYHSDDDRRHHVLARAKTGHRFTYKMEFFSKTSFKNYAFWK